MYQYNRNELHKSKAKAHRCVLIRSCPIKIYWPLTLWLIFFWFFKSHLKCQNLTIETICSSKQFTLLFISYVFKHMNSHRKRYLKIRTCVQNSRAVSTSVHIMHINSLWQLPCLPVCLPVLSSKKDGNCNLRCHKSHRRRLNHPSFALKEKKM